MKRLLSFSPLFLAAAFVLLLAGCDTSALTESATSGTVRILMADAPLDDVAEARVTIQRVELVGEGGVVVLSEEEQEFDLLELQNGITADLALEEVPSDNYHQLRIIVAEEATLVFKDGTESTLKIPSGAQTGIKINIPEFEIDDGADEAEILIDFNVAESFVKAGRSGKYIFKPVIHAESTVVNGEELDEDIDVTGAITAVTDTSVAVEGIRFALTSETELEVDTLAAGQYVQLEADSMRFALEIEAEDPEDHPSIKAPLESVSASSLVALGVSFDVTTETKLDGLASLTDLRTGEFVDVEFRFDAETETYTALKIEQEREGDEEDEGEDADDRDDE